MRIERAKLVYVLLGGLGLGCGTSTSDPPKPGAAGASGDANTAGASATGGSASGTAGAGGGSAGVGGSTGGGAVVGNTPAEACVAYVLAACSRRAVCQGQSTANCAYSFERCPDMVFGDGSKRTVAELQACAALYPTYPCEKVLTGELPSCVTFGTRQPGDACLFPAQCESGECRNDQSTSNACGTCRRAALEGEPCSEDTSLCIDTHECQEGKCVRRVSNIKEPGEACTPGNLCRDGYCDGVACKLAGAAGQPCSDVARCASGLYCGAVEHVCGPPAAPGQPCFHAMGVALPLCAGGACRYETLPSVGTCGAYAKLGESCRFAPVVDASVEIQCAPGTHCNYAVEPTCVADGDFGAVCATARECKSGLDCLCPADQPADCTSRVCGRTGFAGDPCSATGNPCYPAFSCEANRCVPKASQGLFAAACPNQ